jgi:hypothetical protein
VRVHISSVNSGLAAPPPPRRRAAALPPCPLMIFEEVTRNESQLVVRQCTAVNPHVRPLPGLCPLARGSWNTFHATARKLNDCQNAAAHLRLYGWTSCTE